MPQKKFLTKFANIMYIPIVLLSALASLAVVRAEGVHYCQPRLPDNACIKKRSTYIMEYDSDLSLSDLLSVSAEYHCVSTEVDDDEDTDNSVGVFPCNDGGLNRWNFTQVAGSEDYEYEYHIINADTGHCIYPRSSKSGASIAEAACGNLDSDQTEWKITWKHGKGYGWSFKHIMSNLWLNVAEHHGQRRAVLGDKYYFRVRDHKGNWPGSPKLSERALYRIR